MDVTNRGFSYLMDDVVDEVIDDIRIEEKHMTRTLAEGRVWVEFHPPFEQMVEVEILLTRYLRENDHGLTETLPPVRSAYMR